MNQIDNLCGISRRQLECKITQKNRRDHQIARRTVRARIILLSRDPTDCNHSTGKVTGWEEGKTLVEDPRACLGAFPLTWETWDGGRSNGLWRYMGFCWGLLIQLQLAHLQCGNGNTSLVGLWWGLQELWERTVMSHATQVRDQACSSPFPDQGLVGRVKRIEHWKKTSSYYVLLLWDVKLYGPFDKSKRNYRYIPNCGKGFWLLNYKSHSGYSYKEPIWFISLWNLFQPQTVF